MNEEERRAKIIGGFWKAGYCQPSRMFKPAEVVEKNKQVGEFI